MVATAVAVATDLDVRFQTALANDFPSFLTNPTRALERSDAVEDRLADLRGAGALRRDATTATEPPRRPAGARQGARTSPATSAGSTRRRTRRSTCSELRGRVVLVDFWTYTCINCIRTLPVPARLGRALPRGAA